MKTRTQKISLNINSRLEDTVLVAMAVRGVCAMTAMSQQTVNQIELCIVEVVNNAIEHAYQGEAGHQVSVDVILTPQESLELVVRDSGRPMITPLPDNPELVIPDPENPETWGVSGRGLPIVGRLMDAIRYESNGQFNAFHMLRQLN